MELLGTAPLPHQRKHLVIVRAGPKALHLDWTLPAQRQWDLITLAYDDSLLTSQSLVSDRTFGDWLVDSRAAPSKFYGLQDFFNQHPEALNYASVLMPDDDLLFDPAVLDAMFQLFEDSEAALGQPALSWDSYLSHFVTLENRAFCYRYTNFAEVMTPIMTGATLARLMPTFKANKSSWGMDLLWAKMCADQGQRLVILDKTPVKHTRPVGGAGLYKALGVNPEQECMELLRQFGVPLVESRVLGGMLNPDFDPPRSGSMLESLIAGLDAKWLRHPGFLPVFRASLPALAH